MALKRVNKEIKNFYEKPSEYFKKISVVIYCDTVNFVEISDNNKVLLTLIIPNEYPFKPYKVYSYHLYNKFNYHKYISMLNSKNKIHDNKILKFFYRNQYNKNTRFLDLNSNECYCCFSRTCPSHWYPALNFKDILNEYLEISFIDKYSKPYNYLFLENIYNNLFGKIPDEIIELFINFQ